MQNYEKSARFPAGERNNRENFAPSHDRIVRRSLENSARNHKTFATSGFTIIEVALVLAIAGLIFLVVFLALPALQAAQRENALKNSASQVAAAIEQFYADGGNAADIPSSRPAGPKSGDPTQTWTAKTDDDYLGPYLKNVKSLPNGLWVYGNRDPFADEGTHPGRQIGPLVTKGGINVYFGDKCWTADSPAGGR